jgi:Flp pilus assembly pilin Flp
MTPSLPVHSSAGQSEEVGPEPSNNLKNPQENKMKKIKNFIKDESGMETLEYAVVAGLIALAAVFVYLNSNWKTTLVNRLNTAATQS